MSINFYGMKETIKNQFSFYLICLFISTNDYCVKFFLYDKGI